MFSNGVAVVHNENEEYGVINIYGELVVPFGRYTRILGFGSQLSAVSIGTREEDNILWGFIDTSGTEVIPPIYCGLYIMRHPFFARSQTQYIDWHRTVFIGGTAVIRCSDTLLWGIIDTTGREIVAPAYDSISHFVGDYALANIGGVGEDSYWTGTGGHRLPFVRGGTWFIIDRNGEIVASFDYARMLQLGANIFMFSEYPKYQIMEPWYESNQVDFYNYNHHIGGIDDGRSWQLLILQPNN